MKSQFNVLEKEINIRTNQTIKSQVHEINIAKKKGLLYG